MEQQDDWISNPNDRVTKYQSHSHTSRAAAREIEGSAKTLRGKVYRFLRRQWNGATDEEMQDALELNPSTQRPRRIELVERGLVRDSGETRKTKSNRSAVIWIAV